MEIILISFYVAKGFNMFKTFLILDEDWYYSISTLNNKITAVHRCPAYECDYMSIALTLAFAEQTPMSTHVANFFHANHKQMFKKCDIYENQIKP